MKTHRITKAGVHQTLHGSETGPFWLSHDRCFHNTSARYSHHDDRSVTFKDCRGNYAAVMGVRNGNAWVKRHRYA